MRPLETDPRRPAAPLNRADDEATGLPWLRAWRSVYLLVLVVFMLYVALLHALSRMFS